MPLNFELVHQDDALLVLHKPAGLLSVPGRGADKLDSLSYRVQQQFPEALVVHRLDRDTSGLLIMARGANMQSQLSKLFASRSVHKRYTAVCFGVLHDGDQAGKSPLDPELPETWNAIDLPIWLDWAKRPQREIDPHGQPSLTRWRLVGHEAQDPNSSQTFSRLELEPYTGRTHQLRVHLQALGHPILGDTLYAPPELQALSPRLLLHATRLSLPHPVTGQTLSLHCPPPF